MFKKRISGLVIFLVIVMASIPLIPGCNSKQENAGSYSVSLDVNPSIEILVTDGLVSGLKAYNDDGEKVIVNSNVFGLTGEEALKLLVTEMAASGFIAKTDVTPYLLITVGDNSITDAKIAEEISMNLKTTAEQALKDLNIECNVTGTVADAEISSKSEELGVSYGRYILYSYIAKQENLTIAEVVAAYGHLKIGELLDVFEELAVELEGEQEEIVSDDISETETEIEEGKLTAEQKEGLKLALKQYSQAKKSAVDKFHLSYKNAKEEYKQGLKNIENADKQTVKKLREDLKNKLQKQKELARTEKSEAFALAKSSLKAALVSLGISNDIIQEIIDDEEDNDIDEEKVSLDGTSDGISIDEDDNESKDEYKDKDKDKVAGTDEENENDEDYEDDSDTDSDKISSQSDRDDSDVGKSINSSSKVKEHKKATNWEDKTGDNELDSDSDLPENVQEDDD